MMPKERTRLVIALGIVAGAAMVGGTLYLLNVNRPPTLASMGRMALNGTSYDWTNVTPPDTDLFEPCCRMLNVSFEGVLFRVFSYQTHACNVVNVTGTEASRVTYSFLIFGGIPDHCQPRPSVLLSPDGVFGAIWDGGTAPLTLLAKAS